MGVEKSDFSMNVHAEEIRKLTWLSSKMKSIIRNDSYTMEM